MYRLIDARLWTDPKIRRLAPEARALFVYLITNGHGHVSGVYYLPVAVMVAETGFPRRTVAKALGALTAEGLIVHEADCDLLWVMNMLRYQARGQKIEQAATSQLEAIHSDAMIRRVLAYYPQLVPSETLRHRLGLGDTDTPPPEPENTPSDRVSDTPSDGAFPQKQIQDQKQKPEIRHRGIPHLESERSPPGFLAFWTAYPRKVAKQAAERAWQKLKPDAAFTAVILRDVATRARSPDWQREGGRFVPYPATYLNGRRWEDERPEGTRYAAL